MSEYHDAKARLKQKPETWLVTGGAGFIGSHVVEELLALGQSVRIIDNFFTGYSKNVDAVKRIVGDEAVKQLSFIEADVRDAAACNRAMEGVNRVVHLAAMASVPLSMEKPAECNEINVTGTLHLMNAARAAGVKRFVYASSSAVYGDDTLPTKVESSLGRPLSPYAASKLVNEVYASCCYMAYGLESVGFRFFNVFGPRQDPKGAYAAVIPCWISQMQNGEPVYINGDGGNTRDFCFVKDVVQALLLGATTSNAGAIGKAYNVGLGKATDLNELFSTIRALVEETTGKNVPDVIYRDFRAGDIRHSCADTTRITSELGFAPDYSLMEGLRRTVAA
ncbi:MAG: SDR family oxidoreductase [Verrucomicrobiaceae bacterium]|nr:SDR family oxidoreductase [Verrucomicrobiaceae bacterium]